MGRCGQKEGDRRHHPEYRIVKPKIMISLLQNQNNECFQWSKFVRCPNCCKDAVLMISQSVKNAMEIVYCDFLKRLPDSWFCILLLQCSPSELSLAACDIPCYSFSLFIFSLLYMLNFVAYKSTHSNSYFTLINCKHIRNFRPAQQVETSFILAKYQYRKYP